MLGTGRGWRFCVGSCWVLESWGLPLLEDDILGYDVNINLMFKRRIARPTFLARTMRSADGKARYWRMMFWAVMWVAKVSCLVQPVDDPVVPVVAEDPSSGHLGGCRLISLLPVVHRLLVYGAVLAPVVLLLIANLSSITPSAWIGLAYLTRQVHGRGLPVKPLLRHVVAAVLMCSESTSRSSPLSAWGRVHRPPPQVKHSECSS